MKAKLSVLIILIIFLTLGCSAEAREIKEKINLANKYILEQNYEQAILVFEDIIKIDPKIEQSYIGLAKVFKLQEDIEQAETVLKRGIDAVEVKDNLALHLASLYIENKQYNKVESLLEKFNPDKTNDVEVLKNITTYYKDTGDNNNAIKIAKRALPKNKEDIELLITLRELTGEDFEIPVKLEREINSLINSYNNALEKVYLEKDYNLIADYVTENKFLQIKNEIEDMEWKKYNYHVSKIEPVNLYFKTNELIELTVLEQYHTKQEVIKDARFKANGEKELEAVNYSKLKYKIIRNGVEWLIDGNELIFNKFEYLDKDKWVIYSAYIAEEYLENIEELIATVDINRLKNQEVLINILNNLKKANKTDIALKLAIEGLSIYESIELNSFLYELTGDEKYAVLTIDYFIPDTSYRYNYTNFSNADWSIEWTKHDNSRFTEKVTGGYRGSEGFEHQTSYLLENDGIYFNKEHGIEFHAQYRTTITKGSKAVFKFIKINDNWVNDYEGMDTYEDLLFGSSTGTFKNKKTYTFIGFEEVEVLGEVKKAAVLKWTSESLGEIFNNTSHSIMSGNSYYVKGLGLVKETMEDDNQDHSTVEMISREKL